MSSDRMMSQILEVLRMQPAGLKIADIAERLNIAVSRRTLLRRLQDLIATGDIFAEGERNARRYYCPSQQDLLPLSVEGISLKQTVMLPLQQRTPVGYHRDFLDRYMPNQSYYLSVSIREHLHAIGTVFQQSLPAGTYAKRMLHRLLIDLSWNSSRLEGNTYSLLETQRLLDFGIAADSKHIFETQMILNHKAAIDFIIHEADQSLLFKSETILNLHALLSNNLLPNPAARGQLRKIPVGIHKTVYLPPEITGLIAECFELILAKAQAIIDPFEQAFFVMVHLPYLQAFEDVNKRVSRLAANLPLIKHNLMPLSFIDVPQDDYISGLIAIYELNRVALLRDVFVWAYQRSASRYQLVHNTLGQPDPLQLQYQSELRQIIRDILSNGLHGQAMIAAISNFSAAHIPAAMQDVFCQLVEKELASLHLGNIAIYQIEPAVFTTWLA